MFIILVQEDWGGGGGPWPRLQPKLWCSTRKWQPGMSLMFYLTNSILSYQQKTKYIYLCKFFMNKDKFTGAGLEPATSGLTCRGSTNWAIGGLPILSMSLFGDASQKSWNHILPFSQGSCPSYYTTWEQAVEVYYRIQDLLVIFCFYIFGDSSCHVIKIR